jgi:predicted nuclease of predicted toxin-antitoxin system
VVAQRLDPLPEAGLIARCTITDLEAGYSSTSPADHKADLLIAAAAETADLVVLHYDHDFDLIADITGQQTERIVPAGTIP